ncbi:MAG: DUF547 domain-containing protein [Bryobacteraceae bacterium]
MKYAALALLVCTPLAGTGFDHSIWDRILKKHVNAIGEVDYAAIKKDRADVDAYVLALGESSPDSRKELFPSRNHELAYWINAYNALVTKGVVDAYPTRSVRDLGFAYGFFRRKDYTLGGQKISLLALENDIIRKRYQDARIHFAIVCASISCPRLSPDAFAGDQLDQHLDAATRMALAERRILAVKPEANEVVLSALFDWYKEDYGPVLDFLKKYATVKDREALERIKKPKLKYYDYDWSINDPGSRRRAKSLVERELAGK